LMEPRRAPINLWQPANAEMPIENTAKECFKNIAK